MDRERQSVREREEEKNNNTVWSPRSPPQRERDITKERGRERERGSGSDFIISVLFMLLTRVWLLDRGRMQCLEKGKQDCAPLPAPLPPPQSTSPLPLTPPPAVVCIPFLFFASWCFLTFTVPSPTDSLLCGFLFTSSILALTAHVYCSSLMTTLVLVYYRNRSSGKPPVTLWSQIAMNVPSVCVYVCVCVTLSSFPEQEATVNLCPLLAEPFWPRGLSYHKL